MKKIALVCMSNLNGFKENESLDLLIDYFENKGIEVIIGTSVRNIELDSKSKGEELNKLFKDSSIDYIFDLSGGDSSNSVLEYLDYEGIKSSPVKFVGLSDLTTILNSIYALSNKVTIHYQIKNLFHNEEYFNRYFLENHRSSLNYKFLKGKSLNGLLLGGNIRCLLKLAGTRYMPNFKGNILFLESLSGPKERIETMLIHLKHLGVFNEINGILLGSFTQLDKEIDSNKFFINFFEKYNFPIARSLDMGHGRNKKAIYIGEAIMINPY